jgi:CRISPR-associated protein Csm4
VQSGNPFKRPVLLAKAGSVFWPEQMDDTRAYIGQGLSGISTVLPETVQQGYCPVIPIHLPPISEKK